MPIYELQSQDGQIYEVDAPSESAAVAAFSASQEGSSSSEAGTSMPPEATPQLEASNLAAKGDMVAGDRVQPNMTAAMASAIPFADEIVSAARAPLQAGMNAAFGGGPASLAENFAQNQAYEEAQAAANAEQAPGMTTAAQVMGGLMMGGASTGAPNILQSIVSGGRLKQVAGSAAVGGTVGGVYGLGEGASGFSKEDINARIQSATEAMGIGAAVGGAFPVFTKFAGAIAGLGAKAIDQLKGSTLRSFARELGVSTQTMKRVVRGFDDTADGLATPEEGDLLLDLSPAFKGQVEAIANQPGKASQIIEQNVLFRKNGAGRRIKNVIDETIGSNPGRQVIKRAMLDEQKFAGRMMEEAKSSGIMLDVTPVRARLNQVADVLGVADEEIRAINERLPEGMVPAQMMHEVRMFLDGKIKKEFGPSGNPSVAMALKDVRSVTNEQLSRLAGWSDANRSYMVAKKTQEAFADGQKVFASNAPDPSEIAQELADLRAVDPKVAEGFVKGARDQIAKMMGTARFDATKAVGELAQKDWNREKIEILVGRGHGAKLLKSLDQERVYQETANKITGNSATARRLQGQKEFPSSVSTEAEMTDLMKSTLGGVAVAKLRRMAIALSGSRGEKSRARIAEEFADVMTRTGVDLDQVIDVLNRSKSTDSRNVTVKEAWRAISQSALPGASILANQ